MCRLWALVSKKKIGKFGYLYDAFMQLKNGGPEFSSFDLINPFALLGFHRLAIMDLTAEGNQPFKNVRTDGSCVYCVCNGEIYEHEKIKHVYDLRTKSHSDCEVILPLFEKIGVEKMITKLGDEFAFIILDVSADGSKVKITVGRDPIGVRPLFYATRADETSIESVCFSSELKGLCDIYVNTGDSIDVFPPGYYAEFEVDTQSGTASELVFTRYYECGKPQSIVQVTNMENIYHEIRTRITDAVEKRLMMDRSQFGCLLSGGLDSSLVCAVAKSLLGKSFPVFTIAFESGSSDLPFAKKVAEYLGLDHHIITITEEEALKEIDETIFAIESWDITTIRASVMQRMIAKRIEKNTNIKVLLVGENSDELFLGYLYEHNAPSAEAAHEDSIKLVSDVHRFDGLRADRCMAYHGLEVRLPFADRALLDFVFGLDPQFVIPQKGVEKALLRNAFASEGLLPHDVLWRKKEALSDGTTMSSRSWFQMIQDYVETKVSDEEFNIEKDKFKHCPPFTKESYYYRKKFVEYFGDNESVAKTIPYYWMPKWTESKDPSARTLKVYTKK